MRVLKSCSASRNGLLIVALDANQTFITSELGNDGAHQSFSRWDPNACVPKFAA
jgi:hypothetical protein